ncbi:MAG: S8 family serine peptidase, partial [Acutalibacteraceae bacterium]
MILLNNLPSENLANAAAYYETMQNNMPKNRNDIEDMINSLSKLDANSYIEDECVIFAESEKKAMQAAEELDCTLICWSKITHNALLQINDNRTLPDLLKEIVTSEQTDYSVVPKPNYLYLATEEFTTSASDNPAVSDVGDYDNINDASFSKKNDIIYEKVHLAWSGATGKGVTVAVIDTGVDYDHPDLVNNISSMSARINNGSISHEPSEYNDLHGHGTHVCGIIAAEGNNKIGVIGVAPEAEIISIKATTDENGKEFSYYNLIESIFYAVGNDAYVINLSLGADYSTGNNTDLQAAIDFAESSGVIVVAAAGNSNKYHADYPAAYDNVIAVSSVNSSGQFGVSNYGPEIDFAAVGQVVYSTVINGSYGYKTGTSMATPNVSGAVALILSAYPDATRSQILDMLKSNALDLGDEGYDEYFGHGVIQMDFLAKKLTSGNYNYILLDDGTAKITSCVNETTDLEIPAQIDGKAVTEIAANAFCNYTSLQSVSIPSSVNKIGNGAFDGCTNLTKITVESGSITYGSNIFGENTGVKVFCNFGSSTAEYCEKNGIDYYYKDLTATGIQLDKTDVAVELSQSISVVASTTPAHVYGEFT